MAKAFESVCVWGGGVGGVDSPEAIAGNVQATQGRAGQKCKRLICQHGDVVVAQHDCIQVLHICKACWDRGVSDLIALQIEFFQPRQTAQVRNYRQLVGAHVQ